MWLALLSMGFWAVLQDLLYKPMLTNDIASQCLVYLGSIFCIACTLPKENRKKNQQKTHDIISNMHPGSLALILLIGNISCVVFLTKLVRLTGLSELLLCQNGARAGFLTENKGT